MGPQEMMKASTMVAGSPTVKEIMETMHDREKGTNFSQYDQTHKVGALNEI